MLILDARPFSMFLCTWCDVHRPKKYTSAVKVYKRPLMPGAAMLEAAISSATLLTHHTDGNESCKAILADGVMPNAMVLSPKSFMYCVFDRNRSIPMVSLRSQLGPHGAPDHMRGDVGINKGISFAQGKHRLEVL